MSTEMTYVERGQAMSAEAMASRLAQDATKYAAFQKQMQQVETFSVKSANITRELGLSFAEYWLPGEAAAAENHFNSTYKPTLKMSFEVFQWIIAASRRLPDKCRAMEDLYPAIKQMWFAGELLEEGHRDEPQEARAVTPVVAVFERLSKARAALERTFEDVSGWDGEMRSGVMEQIARHEEWLAGVKLKIQNLKGKI